VFTKPLTPRYNARESWAAARFSLNPLCIVLVSLIAAFWALPAIAAETPALLEYQIKAAFLLKFPKYAEWPPEAFPDATGPLVIAVLGESKVTEEIQKGIAGRTINGREVVLKQLLSPEDAIDCHILFVAAAEQPHVTGLLARLKNRGVLTVGESDGFLAAGGVINLALRDRKVSLEVNLAAADRARIKISSKLLSVANVVTGKEK
jgi:hypothetical protein